MKYTKRAKNHHDTVPFASNTEQLEAAVISMTDGLVCRRVSLSTEIRVLPQCCGFTANGDVPPYFHFTAFLSDKYGSSNPHFFNESHRLISNWKNVYQSILCSIPFHADIDDALSVIKIFSLKGTNMYISKSLPPPHSSPITDVSVRRMRWFENRPAVKKKESYSCSIYKLNDYTAKTYQLC